MLWERRRDNTLTHAAYTELHGVRGALSSYAEEVYAREPEPSRPAIARLFAQLVRPGEATGPTAGWPAATNSATPCGRWPSVSRPPGWW